MSGARIAAAAVDEFCGPKMAERRTKITLGTGEVAEGVEVPVTEAIERWSELRLEDGSIIRVKMTVSQVIRTEQYDAIGNPIYVMNMAPTVAVIQQPENLRKKV
jgi:hypothetical protein